jgi:carbon storage regulator CsrA
VLVLSRRPGEKIVLPDLGVTVEVVAIKGGVVRLGITAPPDVKVMREELLERAAAPAVRQPLPA